MFLVSRFVWLWFIKRGLVLPLVVLGPAKSTTYSNSSSISVFYHWLGSGVQTTRNNVKLEARLWMACYKFNDASVLDKL